MENKNKVNQMESNERDQMTAFILRALREVDDPRLMQIYLFVLHIL